MKREPAKQIEKFERKREIKYQIHERNQQQQHIFRMHEANKWPYNRRGNGATGEKNL